MIYDLAIIGGGPAAAGAAVYAARKRLRTVVIAKDWLGQSNVSEKIENWIGTIAISGLELSKSLERHAKAYGQDIIDFKDGETATKISTNALPAGSSGSILSNQISEKSPKTTRESITNQIFKVTTNESSYEAKAVLMAAGSQRRKLDIPTADKFEHKGLTYCATCDGPLFAGQDVVVVGGGNAGFESAAQLLAYCKSVTLIARSEFKADPGTIEKVTSHPNMKALEYVIPKAIAGDKFVSSITYSDTRSGKDTKLSVSGIFAEIGSIPNTSFAKELVKFDETNHVVIDSKNQRTSFDGIWAAGDCTDGLYHQNNIAAGDAVKAVEDIYLWLHASTTR